MECEKGPAEAPLRDDPSIMAFERTMHSFAATFCKWSGPGLIVASLCLVAQLGGCRRGDAGGGSSAPLGGDDDSAEPRTGQRTGGVATRDLDAAVAAMWTQAGVEPAGLVDDAAFYRRVSLDLRGRIPAEHEARAFLADTRADKRERAVDALLASDEYAAYWAEVYSALLLGDDKVQTRAQEGFETWLESQLHQGTGWDALAVAMVTAQGDVLKEPAGVFISSHLRQSGPELLTGALTRKMLGVQIECAQCHDHPYSDFTREDFYAMAAFFTRTKVQRSDKAKGAADDEVAQGKSMAAPAKGKRSFVIADRYRGEMRIKPIDEAGNEGERKVKIAPAFLGVAIELDATAARRPAFAQQMVASELFAPAAVGFVWTELFGRGIQDPWDELGDAQRARPPALDLLSAQFVEHGYDLRWLLRTIVLSQAYQRAATGDALDAAEREDAERVFARAAVRPLRSAQLFRSLLEATGLGSAGGKAFRRAVNDNKNKALAEYAFIFADDEAQHVDAFSGNVPQALLLLNGALTNQGAARAKGSTLDAVLALEGFQARLESLHLRVFGRTPSEAEIAQARTWVQGNGEAAWEDLLFAMLNSSEFTSNH